MDIIIIHTISIKTPLYVCSCDPHIYKYVYYNEKIKIKIILIFYSLHIPIHEHRKTQNK